MFKAITGGDVIRVERKHRDAFNFKPYARLLFSANQAPPTVDSSQAWFDRWTTFPFHQRFRGTAAQDYDLLAKLTTAEELSGLLNRALEALAGLRERRRFTTTPEMREAATKFRQEADTVAGFMAERCELVPDARSKRSDVYEAYNEWVRSGNRKPLGRERNATSPGGGVDTPAVVPLRPLGASAGRDVPRFPCTRRSASVLPGCCF